MNYAYRAFIALCAIIAVALTERAYAMDSGHKDHLVELAPFFVEEGSLGAAYWKLVQQKLFVTRGEAARFVFLPGLGGKDSVASVHRDTRKKDGMPGGYWLTVTQASDWLWLCIPQGTGRVVDPRRITVERCDVPLPENTAVAIHEAWLAMLAGKRPADPNVVRVDGTIEVYSATNSKGVTLMAVSGNHLGGKTSALFRIATRMLEYCYVSPRERLAGARKIEEAAIKIHRMADRDFGGH